MQEFNTRIASRTDTKENWELNNPILLQGEIAIVFDGTNQLFKVGDGQKHFNDLQYSFYEHFASEQINTSNLRAKSISQGFESNVNGIGGIATGYKSQVSSNFAQSHGYQAKVSSDFGYVWNGDNTISNYSDHGNGSFNVNPKDGISGLYIGDRNLKEIIEQESPKPNTAGYGLNLNNGELSVDVTKIAQQSDISDFSKVTLISNDVVYSKDLSVVKIAGEEYYKLVVDEKTNPSVLYVVDDLYLNAYGQTIKNVASPELSNDAATKNYVDLEIAKIPQPDFTESNSLLVSTITAKLPYLLNTDGTIKDRAINTLTFTTSSTSHEFDLAAALPTATSGCARDFLIHLVSDAKVTFITGSMDIRGDGLVMDDGAADRLITVTEITSGVWYVRSIDITKTEA